MPSSPAMTPRRQRRWWLAVLCIVLVAATACGGDPEEAEATPEVSASGDGPTETSASDPIDPTDPTDQPVQQPPLPPDPSGYTTEYVQATLNALFHDYQTAVVAYQASGQIDDTVRSAMAAVYHPDVYDQQIRNLEDYFPGGENLEDPPGAVEVEVTDIHSVAADCILAITTYNIDAVTTLDAPAEEGFFIGLARNVDDPDGVRPWLITVEYTTSDGEPLPEDVCA